MNTQYVNSSSSGGVRLGTETKNKVLRNTYMLLSLTLMFSAAVSVATVWMGLPHPGLLVTLGGYFGLLFLTYKTKDSAAGIASVFALTGFMGYTLGPMIGAYWAMAPMVVTQALAITGVIFISLSLYVTTTKKDFSFMGSFLFVGIIAAFALGLAAYFFNMPGLSLAVSGLFVLLMSGMILYETSNIVNGGETNYIIATVSLFVSLYNLFASLMHLLGFMQSE